MNKKQLFKRFKNCMKNYFKTMKSLKIKKQIQKRKKINILIRSFNKYKKKIFKLFNNNHNHNQGYH